MKKIINKYLLLFLCIFSLVLPTGCEVKEQKQVVVDYQEYHFRNEDLLESHYEKHGKEMGFSSSKEYETGANAHSSIDLRTILWMAIWFGMWNFNTFHFKRNNWYATCNDFATNDG